MPYVCASLKQRVLRMLAFESQTIIECYNCISMLYIFGTLIEKHINLDLMCLKVCRTTPTEQDFRRSLLFIL